MMVQLLQHDLSFPYSYCFQQGLHNLLAISYHHKLAFAVAIWLINGMLVMRITVSI